MNKLLAMLFLICVCTTVGILVMIHGWGLQVKSWGWIIGGGLGLRMFVEVMLAASKREGKQ